MTGPDLRGGVQSYAVDTAYVIPRSDTSPQFKLMLSLKY